MSDPTDLTLTPTAKGENDFWHDAFFGTTAPKESQPGAGPTANAGPTGAQSTSAWSAQGLVDPNTGTPSPDGQQAVSQPNTGTESFTDLWKAAPSGDAPVRTWVDPTQRQTAQGQFQDAWYDTPTDGESHAAPAATPLAGLISSLTPQSTAEFNPTTTDQTKFWQDWVGGNGQTPTSGSTSGGGDGAGGGY